MPNIVYINIKKYSIHRYKNVEYIEYTYLYIFMS